MVSQLVWGKPEGDTGLLISLPVPFADLAAYLGGCEFLSVI